MGTDGGISGTSWTAPTQAFTSATASFVSTDVGRYIRLINTGGAFTTIFCVGTSAGTNNITVTLSGGGSGSVSVNGSASANTSATNIAAGINASLGTYVQAQAIGANVIVSGAVGGTSTVVVGISGGGIGSSTVSNSGAMLGGGAYDGLYVIDAVNSSTSVNLRCNRNVSSSGYVTSPARFFENASNVTWTVLPSCTFTADVAGDFTTYMPGSFILIEGDANLGNNGLWQIVHRVDSQNVLLSKNWFYTVGDWVGPTVPACTLTLDTSTAFVASTGIRWCLTDRQPTNGADLYEMQHQFLVDAGWQLWQQRGSNTYNSTYQNNVLRDNIYKSTGETQAGWNGGNVIFLRMTQGGYNRNAPSATVPLGSFFYHSIGFAGFLSWDPTVVISSSPNWRGNGRGGITTSQSGASYSSAANPTQSWSAESTALDYFVSAGDLLTVGRGQTPLRSQFLNFVFVGDRSEVSFNIWNDAQQAGNATGSGVQTGMGYWTTMAFGFATYIGQNPNIVPLAGLTTTSGAGNAINTGSYNLSTMGYKVGDEISIRGNSYNPSEITETAVIGSFTTTGGIAPYGIVTASALSQQYGAGNSGGAVAESYLGTVGEDPMPWWQYCYNGTGWTGNTYVKLQNKVAAAGTVGYDSTNYGTNGGANSFIAALPTYIELLPNRRSGRFGISPLHIKYVTQEFRGRTRYLFVTDVGSFTVGKKLFDAQNNTVYVVVGPQNATRLTGTTPGLLVGPIPKNQAGVY
jgi:hypothetical protein